MSDRIPVVCDMVLYTLSEQDATQINKRREDAARNAGAHTERADGSQIHTGNHVAAGDAYPMLIVRAWGSNPDSAVNGQVFLDGNDTFWASSVSVGVGERRFTWPEPDDDETKESEESSDY